MVMPENNVTNSLTGRAFGRHGTDPGCGTGVLFSVFQDIQE